MEGFTLEVGGFEVCLQQVGWGVVGACGTCEELRMCVCACMHAYIDNHKRYWLLPVGGCGFNWKTDLG